MAGRAGQAFSRSSGLALNQQTVYFIRKVLGLGGDYHLLGDSQDPSLELSSLESNVIRFQNSSQICSTSDQILPI